MLTLPSDISDTIRCLKPCTHVCRWSLGGQAGSLSPLTHLRNPVSVTGSMLLRLLLGTFQRSHRGAVKPTAVYNLAPLQGLPTGSTLSSISSPESTCDSHGFRQPSTINTGTVYEELHIPTMADQGIQAASVQPSTEQGCRHASAQYSLDLQSRLPLMQLLQNCEVSSILP